MMNAEITYHSLGKKHEAGTRQPRVFIFSFHFDKQEMLP